jgi:hypothetical protein
MLVDLTIFGGMPASLEKEPGNIDKLALCGDNAYKI